MRLWDTMLNVTQGDNAAMGYYACSMMPPIKKLMLREDKAE